MFLIPWSVDVPQERWPVMNWLILVALVAIFVRQVADTIEYHATQPAIQTKDTRPAPRGTAKPPERPGQSAPPKMQDIPGITGRLMLRGWSLTGLLGYMWLHGGLAHLLGNLLFLWVFGNAVCAKIGNLRYLLLYVLFGVAAGIVHLLGSRSTVIGASGALYGVIGMYLMLFYQNDVTCLFGLWFIVPVYVRSFTISGIWLILFRLLWDVLGAIAPGTSDVAYLAHLGGFGTGFAVALLLCAKGWIVMERYEKSLLQMWQERRRGSENERSATAYAVPGLHRMEGELPQEVREPAFPPEALAAFPPPGPPEPAPLRRGGEESIRTTCACGRTIRVARQYAGRTVRCPGCRQPVVVPSQTEFFGPDPQSAGGIRQNTDDAFLRLVCPCGRRLKVPARHAGRTGKCPHCGWRFKVPPPAL
ncbi:MAG: rhomboid family intramembrane serine protease [Planctomycetes bacterium]|jgi:membrane associated rhomboid family serine protease|nr:rhomboid family intramembrane serine protease [Planctomycetota bacterium]